MRLKVLHNWDAPYRYIDKVPAFCPFYPKTSMIATIGYKKTHKSIHFIFSRCVDTKKELRELQPEVAYWNRSGLMAMALSESDKNVSSILFNLNYLGEGIQIIPYDYPESDEQVKDIVEAMRETKEEEGEEYKELYGDIEVLEKRMLELKTIYPLIKKVWEKDEKEMIKNMKKYKMKPTKQVLSWAVGIEVNRS